MSQVIAVDIDDVLSSQVNALIEFVNEHYDSNLSEHDFKQEGEYWGYYEMVLADNPIEAKKRFEHFLDELGPVKQVIDPAAVQVLTGLKNDFELHIVTSRGPTFENATINWLENEMPGFFRGIHFVHLWDEGDAKATKAKVCMDIGAGYLIDDNVEHCNLAAEAGVHSLLFGDYGWNLNKHTHPNVKKVADWSEVERYFDEKSGKLV